MHTIALGNTGIKTSSMGLGSGGHSRLGRSKNNSVQESVGVVQNALDLGIRLVDTSEVYADTELIIGQALRESSIDRSEVTIASKVLTWKNGDFIQRDQFMESFERSCERLGTDRIDIYFLHAVLPEHYDENMKRYVPILNDLRDQNRISCLGITEMFGKDPTHKMLKKAIISKAFDAVMIGFNILNQSGRPLLQQAKELGIGVLTMFAVRRALTSLEALSDVVKGMVDRGEVSATDIDMDNPLGFLVDEGHAQTLAEAGYRFCRHEPGTGCILSGTGSLAHLRENVNSLSAPPLPEHVTERLRKIFRNPTIESGN